MNTKLVQFLNTIIDKNKAEPYILCESKEIVAILENVRISQGIVFDCTIVEKKSKKVVELHNQRIQVNLPALIIDKAKRKNALHGFVKNIFGFFDLSLDGLKELKK